MRPRFFYGSVILTLCFVNLLIVRGTAASFSVFYVALLEEYGWSHGSGASIASVSFLVYALASPVIGLTFDRLGPRLLIPFAGLLMGTGLFLASRSNALWELYLSYGVVTALGQAGLGFVSHNALISHWFVRRRATAIGIATMGQGVGAILLVPLTQALISRMGWRPAFMILATLLFVTVVPANALFQRGRPEELGQLPDGRMVPNTNAKRSRRSVIPKTHEWTLRSAITSIPFWTIAVGQFGLGIGLFMVFTHMVAHLVSLGYDKLLAAFVFGVMGLTRTGGSALWGYISDHIGRDKAFGISTVIIWIGLAGLIGLRTGSPMWLVYMVAIIYGIGHSAGNPTYGALIGDVFSGAKVGTIFGTLEISFGSGSALGAWLGGYLFDLTGSYRLAFSICFLTFAIAYLAVDSCQAWRFRQSAGTG
ncbi:MAG: MFS transporter [Candidatus Binatia bacterium]